VAIANVTRPAIGDARTARCGDAHYGIGRPFRRPVIGDAGCRPTPRRALIVEELAATTIPPSTFEHRSRERRDAA
jgi:hypothetical protein